MSDMLVSSIEDSHCAHTYVAVAASIVIQPLFEGGVDYDTSAFSTNAVTAVTPGALHYQAQAHLPCDRTAV